MHRQVMLPLFKISCRIVCVVKLCLLFSTVGITELIITPNNTAVPEGTVAVMHCTSNGSNKSVLWKHINSSTSLMQTIYTGRKVYSHFLNIYEVKNTTEGQRDLLVTANTSTARFYICEEPGGKSVGAELIVLESTPICNTTGIGSKIHANGYRSMEAKCVIRFAGNWAPEMNWTITQENDGKQEILDIGENNTYAKRLLISSVIIDAHSSYNGCRLEFRTTFTGNHRSINHTQFALQGVATTANNIPDYNFAWNSSKLTVSGDSGESFFVFSEGVFVSTFDGPSMAIIAALVVISTFVIILSIFILKRWKKDLASRTRRARNDTIAENIYTATDVESDANPSHRPNAPDIVDLSAPRSCQTNAPLPVSNTSPSANYSNVTRVGLDLNSHPQDRHPERQHFNYDASTGYEKRNDPTRQQPTGPVCPPTPSRSEPYENQKPDARMQNSKVPSSLQNSPEIGICDKVEYAELSPHPNADASQSSFRVSMFKKVEEYASIDHTVRALPPPPPLPPSPPPTI